ncbi:hypothetical protein CsatB_013734 [Cannabis sativa]
MDDETEFHALVSCPFAAQCWQVVLPGSFAANITDFTTWFDRICASFSNEKRGEIAMICWSLWGARNDLIWQGKRRTVVSVVSAASQYFVQWKNAQDKSNIAHYPSNIAGDGVVSWVKPIENVLKISVAATFDHSSSYGFGLVARDHNGYLVEAKTVYRRGTMAPDMA